ncbi:MAG: MmcQ/YjbR family DNA-binding protein [Oscillospiraceae bacterium]
MTKQNVIGYALTLDGAAADSPFDGDFETVVLRHSDSRKWFGLIMLYKEQYILNLKCEPEQSDFLKSAYEGITEAYHMNKRLWITVYIDSDVPDDEIKRLIGHSHELTDSRKRPGGRLPRR